MIRLLDLYDEKFKLFSLGIPILEVGEYELKSYCILDNHKFTKTVYFDTTTGLYQSTSTTLVASMFGGFGKILQEQFDKGETVLVEIINKKTISGKYGLAFRTV